MPWELAYAHDKHGNPVTGSLNTLINAVENGAEVRVCIDYDDLGPCRYFGVQSVWIRNGHVHAQDSLSVSCAFTDSYSWGSAASVDASYNKEGLRFLDDAYHYYEIVSTTGDTDKSRWNIGEHKLRHRNQGKFAMKWFVNR